VVLLSSFILYAALCCRCHVRANAQLPHMNIWESGTDSVRIVTAKLEANKIYKKQRGLLEVFVLKKGWNERRGCRLYNSYYTRTMDRKIERKERGGAEGTLLFLVILFCRASGLLVLVSVFRFLRSLFVLSSLLDVGLLLFVIKLLPFST